MTEQKRPRRHRRRGFLLVLILALLAVPLWLWQQNALEVEVISVPSDHLPAAFAGFTIVQLSDVHNKEFGPGNRDLLAAVAEQEPDLIAITGDLISRWGDLTFVPDLAQGLTAIAPTYYVTGNHEWASGQLWELKALLRDCGVTVLENEYVTLERGGDTIVLAGAEDPNGHADQKSPQALMGEIRNELGDPYIVLLAHRNNKWDVYEACRADLVLSGHAHGGIVRLPFTDGLIGPNREFLPAHTSGLYAFSYGGAQVVSRGLVGPRLFNPPHVPVVVLTNE